MTTYFIADLHLSPISKRANNNFCYFIQHYAMSGKSLYILGDFFDKWMGDDVDDEFTQLIKSQLTRLSDKGVAVYFIPGNRDFLVGERFANDCGMSLLTEGTIIKLADKSILLLHGDSLVDSPSYQRFRKVIRSRLFKDLFNALPLRLRLRLAGNLRAFSQHYNQKHRDNEKIMDVAQENVISAMREAQCQQLIHGHTHRPAIHSLTIDGVTTQRIVLAAWHQQGNALEYKENGEYSLIYFDGKNR